MKNIGNKMAMKLAKKKFGDNAGILRHRRCFMIVKIWHLSRRLSVTVLKGIGLSWEKALEDAGVQIPVTLQVFPENGSIQMLGENSMMGKKPDLLIIDDIEEK